MFQVWKGKSIIRCIDGKEVFLIMENQTNQILYEINEIAAKYYCSLLLSDNGKAAISWLNGAGLSEDTINQFRLGYTGKERRGVVSYLNNLGYRNEQILEAGLADNAERGVEDKFINRIMIPIKDDEYRVIGFLGIRIVDVSSIYLISQDNSILEKNRNLFGLDHIRESNEQFVILCEGVFDAMVMNQAGYGMAVSLLGAGFTMEHAKQIKKYTQNVIVCFDRDEYGKKEAERVIGILNQAEITARNLDLSPYRDSLEYISKKGGTAFGRQLKTVLSDMFD